jgi:hypothetical protein
MFFFFFLNIINILPTPLTSLNCHMSLYHVRGTCFFFFFFNIINILPTPLTSFTLTLTPLLTLTHKAVQSLSPLIVNLPSEFSLSYMV